MQITEAEILAAITEALPARADRPRGAFRIEEAMEASGKSRRVVITALHTLKAAGRLEIVPITIERLDGKRLPTTGYRILPAKKK